MAKRILIGLVALSILLPSTAFANFTDLAEDHPNRDAILELNELGCLNGYSDGTVKPDNSITRAETLKLILECTTVPKIFTEEEFTLAEGSSYIINGTETQVNEDSTLILKTEWDPATYPPLQFTDVSSDQWYVNVLKEALVRELITGYADNTIRPTQTVRKADFFTILHRLVPEELQKAEENGAEIAADVSGGQWFANGLSFALSIGVIEKDEAGNLNHQEELTRGLVAQYINSYNNWLSQRLNPTAEAEPEETETPTASEPVEDGEYYVGFIENGVASYYGDSFEGRNTASGETFQPEELVAAHKTLPFGSVVTVTNPENEQWVEVRIIDRGPYVEGRILDLSTTAFEALAPLSRGVVHVTMEVKSLP